MNVKTVDTFHKTSPGFLVFGLVELIVSYALASISIDRGGFWWYVLTVLFLIGALHNFLKLAKKVVRRG
jgi:hypothetical protein